MNIGELMHGIRELDLVLPEFQREYVWSREQAKQLLVSLMRGYPTGSLLLWKTTSPPEIKNSAIDRGRIGTTSVILDGQQRLTTLYLLTRNAIPPYYHERDIVNDPRNLYYHLDSGDLQYYQASRMDSDFTWVPVTRCFQDRSSINVFEMALGRAGGDPEDAMALAQRYNDNLNKLTTVEREDYPIQTVPSNAGIEDAIDVFDRVNSQGTKLSEAELALTHICGKWPHARRDMKRELGTLKERGFEFDLTFMVRALTAVVRGRALFESIHDAPESDLRAGWQRLCKILGYLVTLLPTWAHIHTHEDVSSTNVLVPPIAFLSRDGSTFESEHEIRQFVRWLYAASTWARYSSQTTSKLDHDVSIAVQQRSPWGHLVDAIIDQRGRIDLKAADLEGRGVQTPYYRMAFVLAKREGAIDWYTGQPLASSHTTPWHSHHIFPQSRLYREGGLSPDNHVDRQKVNEIANRAFLTAETNTKVGDALPEQALVQVEEGYPCALQRQFVPTNPLLWKLENYDRFLQHRRELIAAAYNRAMNELLEAPLGEERPSVADLIAGGESAALEFKSSLRWDMRQQQVNKTLQKVIAKTIAGFLNSEGGTLLIGVADDGTIVGIDPDMKTLARGDRDGFEQSLVRTLKDYLGPEYGPCCRISYDAIDGHMVCRVDVERSPKPVFLTDGQNKEFYARTGNTTQPLDAQRAHEYIAIQWQG